MTRRFDEDEDEDENWLAWLYPAMLHHSEECFRAAAGCINTRETGPATSGVMWQWFYAKCYVGVLGRGCIIMQIVLSRQPNLPYPYF
jgi:hypothetical protein